jgi:catechol 2,3-dioxygenase-like lactoylglutathione lyase family enzyme
MKFTLALALSIVAVWSLLAATDAKHAKHFRIVGLTHIAVRAHSLDDSRHFYGEILGFEEAFSIGKNHSVIMKTGLSSAEVEAIFYKVNNRQYIVVMPESRAEDQRFVDYALETDDAEAFRLYLKSEKVKVPDQPSRKNVTGDMAFRMADPDGSAIEVMQYTPDSVSIKTVGKFLSGQQISTRLLHVGLPANNPQIAQFYFEILGFREFWRATARTGDMKLATLSNLKVPNGDDYVEWSLSRIPLLPFGQRKGPYHIALEVPDMAKAVAAIKARPAFAKYYQRETESHVGQNHKWQGNFYDPDGTRVELMEDHTADGFPSPISWVPLFSPGEPY